MKKRLCILLLIGLLSVTGCTSGQTQKTVKQSQPGTVSPYKLTQKEAEFLSRTLMNQSQIWMYKIQLPTHSKIEAKVDHFQNGKYKQTIINMSSELIKGESLISIGLHDIVGGNGRLWFASLHAGKGETIEQAVTDKGSSSSVSISGTKKLTPRFTVIGAFVHNINRSEIRAMALDDKQSLNTMLKENENVYVFSCRIQ